MKLPSLKKISLVLFILTLSGLLLLSSLSFDITVLSPQIKASIESKISGRVELNGASLRLLPIPTVTIKSLQIYDGNDLVIRSDKAKIIISYLSILKAGIVPDSMVLEMADFNIVRKDDGSVNISKVIPKKAILRALTIRNSKAVFKDHYDGVESLLRFTGLNASLEKSGDRSIYRLVANILPSGTIRSSGEIIINSSHKIKLNIKSWLTGIKTAALKPYMVRYIMGNKVDTTVDLNAAIKYSDKRFSLLTAIDYDPILLDSPSSFKPVLLPGGKLVVDATMAPEGNILKLNNTMKKTSSFSLNGSLELKKISTEERVKLQLASSVIPVSFLSAIRPETLSQRAGKILKEISLKKGTVKIDNLYFSGIAGKQSLMHHLSGDTGAVARGTVRLEGIRLFYHGLPTDISNINGRIKLDSGRVRLDRIKGNIGKSAFDVSGEVSGLFVGRPAANLNMKARVSSDTLHHLYPETGSGLSLKGKVDLKGKIMISSLDKTFVSFSADATEAGIKYGNYLAKKTGDDFRAKLDLLIGNKGVKVKRASIFTGRSSIYLSGSARGYSSYDISIKSSNIHLKDVAKVSPLLIGKQDLSGSITMGLRVLKNKKMRKPFATGKLQIKNGVLSSTLVRGNIGGLNGTVRLGRRFISADIDSVNIGKSSFSARVKVPFSTGRISFNLKSKRLHLQDILPSVHGSDNHAGLTWRIPHLRAIGKLEVNKGYLSGIEINSLKTGLVLDRDRVIFRNFRVGIAGGLVSGSIDIVNKNGAGILKSKLRISDLKASDLLESLGTKKKIVDGKISGAADISYRRGLTPYKRGMNGSFSFSSRKGKLWKFVFISKIFSVVNIISIEDFFKAGLSYETFSGDFKLRDGVIYSDNILLNSNSLKMSAAGKINLAENSIDGKLGMHPFVTIDKLITKIPVIGWIIGGKEKSTFNIYYSIAGPLRDPDVKLIPIESVGGKLFGIIRRTLEAPIRTVEPLIR